MPQEKANEREWMDEVIMEDTIQEDDPPLYQYSEFENVELVGGNVYKATVKTSQDTVALKCVRLTDEFTLDGLMNEVCRLSDLRSSNYVSISFHLLPFISLKKTKDQKASNTRNS